MVNNFRYTTALRFVIDGGLLPRVDRMNLFRRWYELKGNNACAWTTFTSMVK